MCALPDPRSAPPHAKYHGTPAPSSPCPCHHGWPHACNTRASSFTHSRRSVSIAPCAGAQPASRPSRRSTHRSTGARSAPSCTWPTKPFKRAASSAFGARVPSQRGLLRHCERCAAPAPPAAPVDRAREHARRVCAQRMDTDGYYTRTTEEQGWVVDLTLLRLGVIRCHPLPPHSLHTAAATTARPYACVWPRERTG